MRQFPPSVASSKPWQPLNLLVAAEEALASPALSGSLLLRYLWRAIADNGVEGPPTALRSGCFPRLVLSSIIPAALAVKREAEEDWGR